METSNWKSDLTSLRDDSKSILNCYRNSMLQNLKFHLFYGNLFLKLWPNICANRFEIDSEILKKFDGMFIKTGSKRWSFASAMEISFWRSDLTFLRNDSKSNLKFWRILLACLWKGVPKPEVSLLLWRPFLKVWPNISARRFEFDSDILKKFDGMFTYDKRNLEDEFSFWL